MYTALLEKIFSAFPMYHKVGTSAYKEGLENIELLTAMAGFPEKQFKSIHIAGTNGKGSTAHLFSSLFQEMGYKVGLYTSPHLVNFNERIKINGKPIAEEEVIKFFDRYEKELAEIEPSFFEMVTVLAFDYFAQQQVDIAIIEVGLGGRLDATNVITPELSVITNISLDHTQLLGDSLASIAGEKAGIIKSNIPVIIGDTHPETSPVFIAKATEQNAPIYFADQHFQAKVYNDSIDIFQGEEVLYQGLAFPLQGDYQLKNIVTFIQTVEVLKDKFPITPLHIQQALTNLLPNTGLIGRWQVVADSPLTICDAGHNSGAFEITAKQLEKLQYKTLHFVFGVVNDKDVEAILPLLPKHHTIYYICRADIERSLEPELLVEKMHGFETRCCGTVKEAYQTAKKQANEADVIFVGGSCFVVGDFLKEG